MRDNDSIMKRSEVPGPIQPYGLDDDFGYDSFYGEQDRGSQKKQLLNILHVLRKHWFLILAINLVVTGLVVVYEAQKPDYYKAEAKIQVNNETNPAMSSGNGGSSIILSQGNDPTYFATQLQILESSGLIRRVVKSLDLEHNDSFLNASNRSQGSIVQNVGRMFGITQPASSPSPNQPLANGKKEDRLDLAVDTKSLDSEAETLAPYVSSIQRSLDISPVKDSRTASKETRLISIEYINSDPQVASKIVNAVADVYVLQNLESKVESNASANDFFQKRIVELQTEIRQGEERLINYARSNQILTLDSNQDTVVQRLSELNAKLGLAENDRITAEAAYRAALQNPMTSSSAEAGDARTASLEAQLLTLRQQLEQLRVQYTDDWPEVKRVKKQIDTIEDQLQKNRKRATDTKIAALQQTFQEAAARERDLKAQFDAQRGTVLQQNEAAINYRIIQQEIDTNKSLLSSLLQKSRESEVLLNGTPNNVQVVDHALVPRWPAGPQRTKNVTIAFVSSLLLGIGLAFLLWWLDDTIRETGEFESQLGMPLLGSIPGLHPGVARRLLSSKYREQRRIGKYSGVPESFNTPEVAEAFHQVRTSILLSTPGGPPRTLLVTSGQPSEGKTYSSLNLAKSLSQLGGRVLLIDADFRCPKMHVLMGVENDTGLSNLLTIKDPGHEALSRVIRHDVGVGLDLLTSGPNAPNPANLLSSNEMRRVLQLLGETYTHIVIDSPPVLYFADSVILSANVDAVLLIARVNVTSSEFLLQAKKRLHDVKANVIGVVMNDVPTRNFRYYKSDYYKRLKGSDPFDSGPALNGNGNGKGNGNGNKILDIT